MVWKCGFCYKMLRKEESNSIKDLEINEVKFSKMVEDIFFKKVCKIIGK